MIIKVKKPRKLKTKPLENLKEPSKELNKDKKIELLIQKLLMNSPNKDYLHALVLDQANPVELMDIFLKEKNSSFMPRKSTPERNDLITLLRSLTI